MRLQNFFTRLRHWEYWDSRLIYAPVIPYWLYLSLKARALFFFSAVNPSIRNGGFVNESKKEIYDLLPCGLYPETVLVPAGTSRDAVLALTMSLRGSYPLYVKPDKGERGLGVKKVEDEAALLGYAAGMKVDFLVQACVPYAREAGIFYCRLPGDARGSITGIVGKELAAVCGDGVRSLRQLILADERLALQWKVLKPLFENSLDEVPANGEELVLVPYGNHARGARFVDESDKVTPELEQVVDSVCRQVPGFYFGRLDIRYHSWDDLCAGRNFSIIELNGSGSEPTHIYDPRHSLFFAWKEIVRHWTLLYRIAVRNHASGVPYLSYRQGREEIRAFRRIARQLEARIW